MAHLEQEVAQSGLAALDLSDVGDRYEQPPRRASFWVGVLFDAQLEPEQLLAVSPLRRFDALGLSLGEHLPFHGEHALRRERIKDRGVARGEDGFGRRPTRRKVFDQPHHHVRVVVDHA
jgi:hypothetical protein